MLVIINKPDAPSQNRRKWPTPEEGWTESNEPNSLFVKAPYGPEKHGLGRSVPGHPRRGEHGREEQHDPAIGDAQPHIPTVAAAVAGLKISFVEQLPDGETSTAQFLYEQQDPAAEPAISPGEQGAGGTRPSKDDSRSETPNDQHDD